MALRSYRGQILDQNVLRRCCFKPTNGWEKAGSNMNKVGKVGEVTHKWTLEARCDKWAAAAAVEEDTDVLASISLDYEEEGEFCMPGQVNVLQDSDESTHILINVKDYPGLLRVISWVFNGLELVVKKASLITDSEGFVKNQFWVVDRADRPLSKKAADLTAERLGDFIVYCTPSSKVILLLCQADSFITKSFAPDFATRDPRLNAMKATFFEDGPITVDNNSHPKFTVVNVLVSLEIEGALLKVTSALTNSGCSIQKGEINMKEASNGSSAINGDLKGQRMFTFWVTSRDKKKLDYMRAASLLYTMGLVFGKSEGPLRPPSAFRA